MAEPTASALAVINAFFSAQPDCEVPSHLAERLAVLTGGEQIVYADVSAARAGAEGPLLGQFVVMAADVVVEAWLDRLPNHARTGRTASARAWSRADLCELELPNDDTDRLGNSDTTWKDAREDDWPADAHIELSYENHRHLVLPLGSRSAPQRRAFSGFLPSLLADLAR